MITVCGQTFVGAAKSINQDAYCALSAETSLGDAALLAVCDGVGGLASGEVASSAAIRELSRWFEGALPAYAAKNARGGAVDLRPIGEEWGALLADLNARMWRYSRDLNVRMGTTLTALLVFGRRFAIGHVGDCRAYRVRGGSCEQLTRDQTLIQREVEAGRISAEAALVHPRGSMILQALGAQEAVNPAFYLGEAKEGDTFVVACDGFYRRLGEGGLLRAFADGPHATEDALRVSIADAMARVLDAGEKDNITATCLHVGQPGPFSPASASDDQPTELCCASFSPSAPEADDEPTVGLGAE